MTDYTDIIKNEAKNEISVYFYLKHNKPFSIGENMYALKEDAYMNGHNWELLLNHYLSTKAPEVLEEMATASETATYVAFYPITTENEKRAEKLVEIIRHLIENEEELYKILRLEGDKIEWQ